MYKEILNKFYNDMVHNRLFYQPDFQKSWSWLNVSCENETIIDLDKGFYFYIDVDKNCTIKFKNGTLGYQYIILLKANSGKTITWKSNSASGNDKGVYIRFGKDMKFETSQSPNYEYVYLGGVLNYRDDNSFYLDIIAMTNEIYLEEST